jgi:serine/threonine-protein kinase
MKCPRCSSKNPDDSQFCGNCGYKLFSTAEFSTKRTKTIISPLEEIKATGVFIDRYKVLEKLGKGGMGTVFRVLDTEINEEVALKILEPDVSADSITLERFRNELKIARKISHKNVCRVYHLGKEGNTLFITMEYVPGENLKKPSSNQAI